MAQGFNEYVLSCGRPVLLDGQAIENLIQKGELVPIGEVPCYWLGVPLMKQGAVNGVLAVSSYDPEKPLLPKDLKLLTVVSHHLANALERKRAEEALVQANLQLEKKGSRTYQRIVRSPTEPCSSR